MEHKKGVNKNIELDNESFKTTEDTVRKGSFQSDAGWQEIVFAVIMIMSFGYQLVQSKVNNNQFPEGAVLKAILLSVVITFAYGFGIGIAQSFFTRTIKDKNKREEMKYHCLDKSKSIALVLVILVVIIISFLFSIL